MAKVGRTAYTGSRVRLQEVHTNRENYLSKSESGELFAIDAGGVGGTDYLFVFPADAEDGTRYSFWFIDDVSDGKSLLFLSAAVASHTIKGGLAFSDSDGANTDMVKTTDLGPPDQLVIAPDTEQGSWIECVFDKANSRWLICGFISAATAPVFI